MRSAFCDEGDKDASFGDVSLGEGDVSFVSSGDEGVSLSEGDVSFASSGDEGVSLGEGDVSFVSSGGEGVSLSEGDVSFVSSGDEGVSLGEGEDDGGNTGDGTRPNASKHTCPSSWQGGKVRSVSAQGCPVRNTHSDW